MKGTQDGEDTLSGITGLAVLLLVGGIGTILYWVTFFTSGAVHTSSDHCYLVFERAFPAADGWMAAAAIAAAVSLWRRRPSAVLWAIAAGSGLIFLGLMDILYNLEHDMYGLGTGEMAAEIGINVFCMTLGPTAIAYTWRHRRTLDPTDRSPAHPMPVD